MWRSAISTWWPRLSDSSAARSSSRAHRVVRLPSNRVGVSTALRSRSALGPRSPWPAGTPRPGRGVRSPRGTRHCRRHAAADAMLHDQGGEPGHRARPRARRRFHGLKLNTRHSLAGTWSDPPASFLRAIGRIPAATSAGRPPDDPPADSPSRHGSSVGPCSADSVCPQPEFRTGRRADHVQPAVPDTGRVWRQAPCGDPAISRDPSSTAGPATRQLLDRERDPARVPSPAISRRARLAPSARSATAFDARKLLDRASAVSARSAAVTCRSRISRAISTASHLR